jgi:hypothetical protein
MFMVCNNPLPMFLQQFSQQPILKRINSFRTKKLWYAHFYTKFEHKKKHLEEAEYINVPNSEAHIPAWFTKCKNNFIKPYLHTRVLQPKALVYAEARRNYRVIIFNNIGMYSYGFT